MEPLISLNNLFYHYESFEALRDISLAISKGDSLAIIGTNGSGKSTLLKILNGIYFATGGSFVFEGDTITEKKMKDNSYAGIFHKRIGFVFQNSEVQLFCSSVFEEIAFGPRQMGLEEQAVKERVDDCLQLLQIEHLRHREPYHLSDGEKKKVALASVLSLNPEVIILDEPMNNLDPRTKHFLRELLIELNGAGKTIICATHDFEYVSGVFKRIIVLSENHTIIREDEYDKVMKDINFLRRNNIK